MNDVAANLEPYLARYRNRPATHLPEWQALRDEAMQRAAARGFPQERDESWKYTSTRQLVQRAFAPAGEIASSGTVTLQPYLITGFDTVRLVLINGRYMPARSDDRAAVPATFKLLTPDAHTAKSDLGATLKLPESWRDDVFANLNTAFAEDIMLLEIPANVQLERPLEILHLSLPGTPACNHVRIVLRVGRNARLQLVERYAGAETAAHFTNTLAQITLDDNAVLEHIRMQTESERGFHVGRVLVEQAAGSQYLSHNLQLGGYWVRLDLHTRLTAPGARAELNGLYAVNGRRHLDNHTRLDHAAPNTTSTELYHGLLDGTGRAVFNGKVVVAPHAAKTDASQTNRNLLLSRGSEIDTKPELEIYADDVRCSHGATIGQLDDDQLFYLRARGLDESAARGLLVGAFANALIGRLPSPALRTAARSELDRMLNILSMPEEA